MLKNNFAPTLDSFPMDDQYWRLDWYGDIFYDRYRRYRQPFIRLSLSKTSINSDSTWNYPTEFLGPLIQQQIAVPVGTLPYLPLGSIWKNGKLVIDPDYRVESFSIGPTDSSKKIIKAGIDEEGQGFLLPFHLHPYHKEHTHTYCVQVRISKNELLLVPAVEIFRFYFGSSSSLISRMHSPPLMTDKLWKIAEKDQKGKATVELASGLSGASAADVARIAFSNEAQYSAKLYTNSLLTTVWPSDKVYPKISFPFTGKSQLRAKGVWLDKTFLALQLLSCSHQFPFTSLKYTMSKKQSATGTSKPERSGNEEIQRASRSAGKELPLVDEAPDKKSSPRIKHIRTQSRFPDLDRKFVTRTDPIKPVRLMISKQAGSNIAQAIGEGERKSDIRSIELVRVDDAPDLHGHPMEHSEYAKFLAKYVKGLHRAGVSLWFVPLDSRQRYPQISLAPQIITEHGEIHPLSRIEGAAVIRPRHVSVIMMNRFSLRTVHLVLEGENEHLVIKHPAPNNQDIVDAVWVGSVISNEYPIIDPTQAIGIFATIPP